MKSFKDKIFKSNLKRKQQDEDQKNKIENAEQNISSGMNDNQAKKGEGNNMQEEQEEAITEAQLDSSSAPGYQSQQESDSNGHTQSEAQSLANEDDNENTEEDDNEKIIRDLKNKIFSKDNIKIWQECLQNSDLGLGLIQPKLESNESATLGKLYYKMMMYELRKLTNFSLYNKETGEPNVIDFSKLAANSKDIKRLIKPYLKLCKLELAILKAQESEQLPAEEYEELYKSLCDIIQNPENIKAQEDDLERVKREVSEETVSNYKEFIWKIADAFNLQLNENNVPNDKEFEKEGEEESKQEMFAPYSRLVLRRSRIHRAQLAKLRTMLFKFTGDTLLAMNRKLQEFRSLYPVYDESLYDARLNNTFTEFEMEEEALSPEQKKQRVIEHQTAIAVLLDIYQDVCELELKIK